MSPPICPDLKKQADEALRIITAGKTLVTMAGPAGCGKTTAIKHIVDTHSGKVCVAAYMGQASRMLQKRGIPATTLHKLLFHPAEKRKAEIERLRKEIKALEADGGDENALQRLHSRLGKLNQPGFILNKDSPLATADFCIVDEATMVGLTLGRALERFERPLLLVGDPYQLQPVDGDAYFNLNDPDIELNKIHRQAEDNTIIEWATALRNKTSKSPPRTSDVRVRERARMNNDDTQKWLLWGDRIVCATNSTRRSINHILLKRKALGPYPTGSAGEELICLKNYWHLGLLNGMPIRLTDVRDSGHELYFYARVLRDDGIGNWVDCGRCKIYRGHFKVTANDIKAKRADELRNLDDQAIDEQNLVECDWSYCTTVHKAQGSEFEKVVLVTEHWPEERTEDWWRWMYTAVTRAQKELRIIARWDRR